MTREQMIEKLRRHSCPSCAMTDDEYAETAGWNSAITAVLAALHAEPPTPARLSPEQHERIDRLLAQGVMDSRITFGEHEAITILLAATEPPPPTVCQTCRRLQDKLTRNEADALKFASDVSMLARRIAAYPHKVAEFTGHLHRLAVERGAPDPSVLRDAPPSTGADR